MSRKVLILGGTAEGRQLAQTLTVAGVEVVSSLAGRVKQPRLPAGEVRLGPFGGAQGLASFLRAQEIGAVLDATHPFAGRISNHAQQACARLGVPLLRFERPPWRPAPGDRWRYLDTVEEAAAFVGERGGRVFLTVGRQGLDHFCTLSKPWFLVRCVECPQRLPPRAKLLLDRGPFTLQGERALFSRYRIGLLVTKESGGAQTEAKLLAARERRVEVVVVRRPKLPEGVATTASLEEACRWAVERAA